jgi:hypothetical protein
MRTAGLTSIRLRRLRQAGKFGEANAAIAALANVSVLIAENMMIETHAEGVMILAKVSGMSSPTVQAIIHMHDDLSGMEQTDLRACKATYERLRPSTAQQVLLPPYAANRRAGGRATPCRPRQTPR